MKRIPDKNIQIIAKVVMTALFIWSGLFWSGVSIIYFGGFKPEYSYLAAKFAIGCALILVSLILCWLRFYMIQALPCAIGLAVYLSPVSEMITHVNENNTVDSFRPMTFEVRYLPMVGLAVLAAALFIGRLGQIILTRREKSEEYNNRPAESVLEKHHDE